MLSKNGLPTVFLTDVEEIYGAGSVELKRRRKLRIGRPLESSTNFPPLESSAPTPTNKLNKSDEKRSDLIDSHSKRVQTVTVEKVTI